MRTFVVRTVLVLGILALTAGVLVGQQPTLTPQAKLALAGEIVALAACNNSTRLVVATKAEGATTLRVLDTLTRQPVGAPVSIPSTDPTALALNADCSAAFLADATANSVVIVALPSGTTKTLKVGQRPIALARATHNNDLYVVNAGDGTLTIIDAAKADLKADISTIPIGASPEGIALYSAGAFNRAFVTHSELNAITVTDINDDPNNANRYKVIHTARTGPKPGPIATAPGTVLGDLYAYFINTGNDTLSRIATTTFQIDSVLPVGDAPRAVFLDPVLSCVYTVNTGARSGVGFVKASFIASPGAQPGQDPFHSVQLLSTAERLSEVALLASPTVVISPSESRRERQLWVAHGANPSELLLYSLTGFCTQ
ncbi:MAG: YncE family protein [Candidatus Bipolaricaulota bacterium]|nr:YncE family protein [Candidatus Bipolaricaulota bacterium]